MIVAQIIFARFVVVILVCFSLFLPNFVNEFLIKQERRK